jgi:hypothetical protein
MRDKQARKIMNEKSISTIYTLSLLVYFHAKITHVGGGYAQLLPTPTVPRRDRPAQAQDRIDGFPRVVAMLLLFRRRRRRRIFVVFFDRSSLLLRLDNIVDTW